MRIQSIFKHTILFALLLGGIAVSVQASNGLTIFKKSEFTKTIKKEFQMSGTGEVSLANKYGKVDIQVWDKNVVKINVNIIVKARNEKAANQTFDRIDVDFSNSNSYVKAETVINSSKKGSWNLWGNNNKGNDFRINYEVFMPKNASLDLYNKYGNAEVAAIGGDAKISVKYGDFRVESVGRKCEIVLGYGNGTIVNTGDTRMEIKYSKMRIKEANHVEVDSKYSKIYIDQAADVSSTSKYDSYELTRVEDFTNSGKYDNFEIEQVRTVRANAKYSDFDIEQLGGKGHFDLQYGEAKIEELMAGFGELELNGSYTQFKVQLANGVGFELDADANYADIHYPSGMDVSYEKEKNSHHTVRGSRAGKSGGTVRARMSYGGLRLY